jgi:glycosyltransferase involved in cell wall biosynthesis
MPWSHALPHRFLPQRRSKDTTVTIDLSVVIPTYRRPQLLARALKSVLGQPGVTLEVLVVDDCPDGSAAETVSALQDKRVRYLRNPRPSGGVPSAVRNLGWPGTSGTLLHFLDDDDRVPDGHYQRVIKQFAHRPDVGMIFGRIVPFGDSPAEQMRHEHAYFEDAAHAASLCERLGRRWSFVARMLFDRPILVCSAGVMRRTCVQHIGGFDPEIRLMEDADFFTRAIRHCGACFIPQTSLHYHIGNPSLMHAPHPSPEQLQQQRMGRRRMQAKYRATHGWFEFYALALFARFILRPVARLSGSA